MWTSKEDAVRDFMKLNGYSKENEAIISEALSCTASSDTEDEFSDYGKFIDPRTGENIDISSSDSENKEDSKGWGRGMIIKRFKDIGISRMQIQMVQKVGVGNHMIERYFAKYSQRDSEKNKKTSDQYGSKEGLKNKEKEKTKNPIGHVKAARKSNTKNVIISKFLSTYNNEDDDKNMYAASASSVIPKSETLEMSSSGTDLTEKLYINDSKNTSEINCNLTYNSKISKIDEEQRQKSDENDKEVTMNYEKTSKSNNTQSKSYYSLASEFQLNRRKKEKDMMPSGKCDKSCHCKKKRDTNYKFDPDTFPPL